MLDEGFWAEIKVGGEHLRLLSERNALGVQTSVYNVAIRVGLPLQNPSMILKRVSKRLPSMPKRT
jgi:hypothetical protein